MTVTLLVLGSGTSQGVPAIGCRCETCRSSDPRDSRLRPSVLLSVDGVNILIDTSSDFRQQMLRHAVTRIDAVLYTHHHFDHIGGFDDLRQFNFLQREAMKLYGLDETLEQIRVTFRYAFGGARQSGGGLPSAHMQSVRGGELFTAAGLPVTPVPVNHGVLPILGYRIGDVAYLTDLNEIPPDSYPLLENLDVLVLDALRHHAHPTHYSLEEAIETARRIGAQRTFFTHIAHNIHHERDSVLLPDEMEFSYDGMIVTSVQHSP